MLANLERFGYAGAIHLVSRSSAEINARACVKTVDELPEGIDVAVLAIPEAGVLDAVRACAARRVGAVVIYASGYAEAGEEGRAKQEQLAEIADAAGMLLLGPNCMGFTNFEAGVPLTFEPVSPYPCAGRAGRRRARAKRRHGGQPARRLHRPRPGADRRGVDRQRGGR